MSFANFLLSCHLSLSLSLSLFLYLSLFLCPSIVHLFIFINLVNCWMYAFICIFSSQFYFWMFLFLFKQVLDLFSVRLVIRYHRPLNWKKTAINIHWSRHRHSRIRKLHLNWAKNSTKRPWMGAPLKVFVQWKETNWFISRAASQPAKLFVNLTKNKW